MKHLFKNCAGLNVHISLSIVFVFLMSLPTFGQTSMKELADMIDDEKSYKKLMKSELKLGKLFKMLLVKEMSK